VGLFVSVYWTAATVETDPNSGKVVDFSTGSIAQMGKIPIPVPRSGARFWCVRGGSSVSNPPYWDRCRAGRAGHARGPMALLSPRNGPRSPARSRTSPFSGSRNLAVSAPAREPGHTI